MRLEHPPPADILRAQELSGLKMADFSFMGVGTGRSRSLINLLFAYFFEFRGNQVRGHVLGARSR